MAAAAFHPADDHHAPCGAAAYRLRGQRCDAERQAQAESQSGARGGHDPFPRRATVCRGAGTRGLSLDRWLRFACDL